MGIPEYWVADLVNDRLLVHTDPVEDKYQTIREFHRGGTVPPHLLPECKIPVHLLLP
jgi:Uma2 family endonuclease